MKTVGIGYGTVHHTYKHGTIWRHLNSGKLKVLKTINLMEFIES